MPEIGNTLREARMGAKLDMNQVESATKIRAKYLRALENEEWDLLPGSTYVKSFLRTYAEYMGLDVTLIIEEYKRQHERPSDLDQLPISPHTPARRAPPRPPRIPRGLIVGAVIVGLLVLFLILGIRNDNGGDDSVPPPSQTTERRGDAAAAARRERRRKIKRARERRERAARKIVRLKLVPQGVVFACVVDASGNAVVPGQNLQPGQPTQTFRSRRFLLTVGNGQVTLEVNGRDIDVPDTADAVGYEITPRGPPRMLPEGERPTCE
ncbi:MAG: helix-turn-helix domain-containing protein [Solirubrobacteraceae bacterium]